MSPMSKGEPQASLRAQRHDHCELRTLSAKLTEGLRKNFCCFFTAPLRGCQNGRCLPAKATAIHRCGRQRPICFTVPSRRTSAHPYNRSIQRPRACYRAARSPDSASRWWRRYGCGRRSPRGSDPAWGTSASWGRWTAPFPPPRECASRPDAG